MLYEEAGLKMAVAGIMRRKKSRDMRRLNKVREERFVRVGKVLIRARGRHLR